MKSSDYYHILKDLHALRNSGEVTSDEFERTKQYVLEQYEGAASPSEATSSELPVSMDNPTPSFKFSSAPLSSVTSVSADVVPGLALPSGLVLERYNIIQPLGWGSYGYTCLAQDIVEDSLCTLRWLHPSFTVEGSFLQRWLPNVEALRSSESVGAARPLWAGWDSVERKYCLVSHYVSGVTLEQWLSRMRQKDGGRSVPFSVVFDVVRGVVQALQPYYEAGWMHGNLKPSNILITENGDVEVLDGYWGVALERCLSPGKAPLRTQSWLLSPEQLLGSADVSESSDVYALSGLLYQLLVGVPPLGDWTLPSKTDQSLPKEIDLFVQEGLSPRPEERIASVRGWWKRVEPLLRSLRESKASSLREQLVGSFVGGELQELLHPTHSEVFPSDNSLEVEEPTPPVSHAMISGRAFRRDSGLLAKREPSTEHESRPVAERVSAGWSTHRVSEEELLSLDADALENKPISIAPEEEIAATKDNLPRPQDSVLFYATLPDELDLELEETPLPVVQKAPTLAYTAIHLPELSLELEQRLLYAKDQTALLAMVKIPAGSFLMGSDPSVDPMPHDNDLRQKREALPDYWISRTPITNRVWLKFVEESGYHNSLFSYLQHWRGGRPMMEQLEHPVVHISPLDLEAFCEFYNLKIPTEAQWEKAARGPEGATWPWGEKKPDATLCNFLESQLHDTSPVGSFPDGASPYGLLDCSGNVWEWCLREKDSDASSQPFSSFVVRGGCFRDYRRNLRCVSRATIREPADFIGARVVATRLEPSS